MKKKITLTIALLLIIGSLCSCSLFEKVADKFGDFDYNGKYLTEYAQKIITSEDAKDLVEIHDLSDASVDYVAQSGFGGVEPCDTVLAILTKYSSVIATTTYYISNNTQEQTRVDMYQGTEFLDILTKNSYEPFGQMIVKYIFVDDNIIDHMNRENENFKSDTNNLIAPFSSPYTFHLDENGRLIAQSHSFTELPASVNGGIGSTFRQDSEYIFDEEGKITNWQSSLGLYTSTPTGTIRQGYIFSVSFEWVEKQ